MRGIVQMFKSCYVRYIVNLAAYGHFSVVRVNWNFHGRLTEIKSAILKSAIKSVVIYDYANYKSQISELVRLVC